MGRPGIRKNQLNRQQRAAVEYTDGPLLVLAGAGSGKTRVITEKIVWLAENRHLPADRIAAITFTNKAAKEMRQRAASLLEQGRGSARQATPLISTFHSLGWRLLRQHAADLGLRPGISILDEQETLGLVRELLPSNTPKDAIQQARWQISRWKNQALRADGQVPEQLGRQASVWALYEKYQQQLRDLNAVDFDDLILLPLVLLEDPDIRGQWQERIRYLLVDEYQDTNETQYQLLKALTGERAALTAVGDDDQSIYGWRGAQPENLDQLAEDFPALEVIKLEQNYRSRQTILSAANAVIANNPHTHEKRLWSALGEGEPIRILPCDDDRTEAMQVAADIQYQGMVRKALPAEFAILYRSNHQSRLFEQALRERKIPYHLSGGVSFFDRTEIKDLLCYLRLLVNPDDNTAFLRIINTPRREIGAKSLSLIGQQAADHGSSLFEASLRPDTRQMLPRRASDSLREFCNLMQRIAEQGERSDPLEAITDLIDAIDYRQWVADQSDSPARADRRLANIDELIGWIRRMAEPDDPIYGDSGLTLTDLLAQLSLLSSLEDDDPGQAVRLMTLHAAKGLEFECVYMVGVEEGLLPHQNSVAESGDAEERRLMYVGITRAQQQLTLTYAHERRRFGEVEACRPSRFLKELPDELVQWDGQAPENTEAERQKTQANFKQLRAMLGEG